MIQRILIAEDHEALREYAVRKLRKLGHDIVPAEDGLEAWRWLEREEGRFDVVVSDHEMPGLTGLELFRKIRESGQWSHLKLFLYTSAVPEELSLAETVELKFRIIRKPADDLAKELGLVRVQQDQR